MTERALKPIQPPRGLQLSLENTMADPIAEIDADQIAQVLTNLVNNALGATKVPGEITVRKAAVRLVLAKQARRLADERNEVRLQFMRTLSLELQAPLNAVDGYVDLMRRGVKGDLLESYAGMIERSQSRIGGMRRMIQDLLNITRLESGRHPRSLDDIDLRDIARSACETVAHQAEQNGIAVHLHASTPVLVTADAGELEMLLNNLVSNAVKHNRTGGQVHITLDRNGSTVSISVADTGLGIDAADVDRLFEEFVRVKNADTRLIQSSGLGLSIVRRIARAYDGDVTVHSEPGQGSTFTVVLPDVAAAQPPTPAHTNLPSAFLTAVGA